MCLPPKPDQPSSSSAEQTRTLVGIGALMLLACLAGPAIGALGVGALAGAGGAIFALGLCFAVPSAALAWRRRAARRTPTPKPDDGQITEARGIEDNRSRERQLGLGPGA